MRDKVKRFLSILMTALMLVNLLPVGALAEGVKISNSVQNRWPWEPKPTPKPAANVYVYVKATGDPELIANLTINSSGWFTIGMSANVPGMGNPSEYAIRSYSFGDVGVSHQTVLSTNFTRWKYNQEINTDDITWTEFYIDNGADDYVKAGTLTWHMNGKIDIRKVPSVYTIQYVDYDTKKVIRSYDEPGYMGQKPYKNITAPASWQDDEYSYSFLPVDGHPQTQTVTFEKQTDTLTFYYKKNTAAYTVNYYLNGTTTKVADSKNDTAPLGETVTKSPIKIDGYTPVSDASQSITITEGTNVINFYYYKNVELTANSDTVPYNGQEQEVSGFTGAPKDADFSEIKVGAKGTDADTYPANFPKDILNTVDGTGKYIVTEANPGTLTINPRTVTLTSSDAEKVYDGTALTNGTVTVSGEGFVEGEGATYNVTGSQTDVGESKNTFSYKLNDNTKEKNYEITKTEGTLKVTANETEVVVTITGHNSTVTYNGSEQSVNGYDVSIAPEGVSYTTADFSFNGNAEAKGTDAGEYKMGLTAKNFENTNTNFTNVTFVVTDGYVKINPRSVTLTSTDDEKVYDGTPLTNDTVTVGGDGFVAGEVTDIKATGSVTNVSEGEVTNTITFKTSDKFNADNYTIIKDEGTLSITPRKVTLTSATLIKDFDGTPLTNGDAPVKETFGTEKAFPDGEGVTYTFKGSQTNAGSSKNMFTYAWNEGTKADNYTICPIEGDLVVTPIDGIKVTITGRKDTQTYDGKPHKVEGYDVKPDNPLFTEKDIEFNGEAEATGTDVRIDPYQMGLKPEQFTNTSNNFTNVEFVVEDGQIVITPRAVTLTSETAGKTYDGTALTKPVVTVGGDGFVEGQVTEIKATGSMTNAGRVANTITFTPNKETFKDGNYAITKTEGTLTINKRSVLITSQSATKTYDGSALTRPAVTITGDGFVPGELAKAEATGSITNVGSTPNAIQYTTTGAFNAANYSIALSVGTLTVTEKPKPEPRRTFNLTINYVYQNGKRAAASYNRGGLKNGETFDITSPVIAGYTASETVVSGTIYNRDIKVTVIYTADGVNLDDYGVPLGLGNITMNVGDCFE